MNRLLWNRAQIALYDALRSGDPLDRLEANLAWRAFEADALKREESDDSDDDNKGGK